jgi:hypothetical protein
MTRPILFLVLILATQSLALAAEAGIGGSARDGTNFTFDIGIGELPAPENYYIPPVVNNAKPELWQTIPLRANLDRPNSTHETDVIESQCVFLSSDGLSFITCARSPQNELSGVVYKQSGVNKNGESRFICIKNCSKRAPQKLQMFTYESGC